MGIEFHESVLVQITARDTSNKYGAGLSRGSVIFADEVLLTDKDEVRHFTFDEVPDPD